MRYGKVLALAAVNAVLLAGPAAGVAAAEIGWRPAGSMSAAREGHTTTLLPGGKVLAVGGLNRDIGQYVASADLYDPAASAWTPAPSMAEARAEHTATLLPTGRVLVAGGFAGGGGPSTPSIFRASAELYDPVTNTWSGGGSLATARRAHTATPLPDGRVLVAGGQDQTGGSLASAEIYDPASNSWSPAGSMATGRSYHTASTLPDGRVLVVGGATGSGSGAMAVATAEVYDPASNSWTPTGDMAETRAQHAAAAIAGGRILVAGGLGRPQVSYDPWVRVTRAEVYDPASGAWTDAGTTSGRFFHTLTPLPGGGALMAGGGDMPAPSTSEIYDPVANAWTPGPNLLQPRGGHAATPLANGEVLISGGSGSSAEVYGELPPSPQCSDRADNDGDGLVDFPTDRGCSDAADQDERDPDLTAPTVSLTGKRVQRLGRSVAVGVRCTSTTEDCIVSATGTLSVPGAAKVYRLRRAARRTVARGEKTTLKLRIAPKARRAARRALRRGSSVRAKLTVRVEDAAGNAIVRKRRIRLRR